MLSLWLVMLRLIVLILGSKSFCFAALHFPTRETRINVSGILDTIHPTGSLNGWVVCGGGGGWCWIMCLVITWLG